MKEYYGQREQSMQRPIGRHLEEITIIVCLRSIAFKAKCQGQKRLSRANEAGSYKLW